MSDIQEDFVEELDNEAEERPFNYQYFRRLLSYLKAHGPVAEDRICKGLRISNRSDFVELIEYLTRLGLVTTGHGGRRLTPLGRKYITEVADLRSRI